MDLKDRFEQLCSSFTPKQDLIHSLWKEIEIQYTGKNRHYHNLIHLASMFRELDMVKSNIINFPVISFSVFYHDFIYDATSKSNEENSAIAAETRLEEIGLDKNEIVRISGQILATQSHQKSESGDINYLLDADLSILGKDPETYRDYTQKIRKEYSIYPDFLYKPGRKKVLKHFLELDSIFKTEYFKGKYEIQAKENIIAELQQL